MERTLRNRLVFGTLMLAGLALLLWFDDYAQTMTRDWFERTFSTKKDPVRGGVGGIGLLLLFAALNPIATQELATLFAAERVRPYRLIAGIGSMGLILHAFLTQFPPFQNIAASVLAFIVVSIPLLAALRRAAGKQTQEAITAMAGTILATLYLGGLGWFMMAIRVKHSQVAEPGQPPVHEFHGRTMVILAILLMVKSTDIGAYFGGRKLGRHKLIPWLSPGKTWEGLFCGLLTAGVVGALFCIPWAGKGSGRALPNVPLWKGFIFGVILGGIGQLGDLLESLMKRDADVKDSGRLIPGFGGILDVIDSPLLASPFAYLLFSLF
jgi:phosphatidate cytidylyltransferase